MESIHLSSEPTTELVAGMGQLSPTDVPMKTTFVTQGVWNDVFQLNELAGFKIS
jgi:hypothetical protein